MHTKKKTKQKKEIKIKLKERSPRSKNGRFIKRGPCDTCGYGFLQYEGNGVWVCDGLKEPSHQKRKIGNPELEACTRTHFDW